jgi:hypothetical protein
MGIDWFLRIIMSLDRFIEAKVLFNPKCNRRRLGSFIKGHLRLLGRIFVLLDDR